MYGAVIDPLARYRYAKKLKEGGKPYPDVVDSVLPCHDQYWQTVSEVMDVRFFTVKIPRVVAFNAASTFKRCRPLGALTNNRSKHQTNPEKGAKTKCTASIKKTTRCPGLASSKRSSSSSVLKRSCASTSALAEI
jgi:hypothetical protein